MTKLVAAVLMTAVVACRPASAYKVAPGSGNEALATVSTAENLQPPSAIVWGRVPYCTCLTDAATANVATALQNADLTANLQELSPRDGWLYFAVSFDPHSAPSDQVSAAIMAGGAEVLEDPP